MTECDRCKKESGNLFCGKCRAKVRKEANLKAHKETEDLLPLIYWDKREGAYRFGCTVRECPANIDGICCTPALSFDMMELHEFDGDNCVKQVCG